MTLIFAKTYFCDAIVVNSLGTEYHTDISLQLVFSTFIINTLYTLILFEVKT